MIGTQKEDTEFMVFAVDSFKEKAKKKFLEGIREHNADGKNGMNKRKIKRIIEDIQEEVIDLWFYTELLKQKILTRNNEESPTPHKT